MKRLLIILSVTLSVCLSATAQQTPTKTETDFIEYMDALYDMGMEWDEVGCSRQADWFFGQAAAAVASWRTAIAMIGTYMLEAENDRIIKEETQAIEEENMDFMGFNLSEIISGLESLSQAAEQVATKIEKATEKMEDKLGMESFRVKDQQWYAARSKGLVSPYPDYFRGFVHDWYGEEAEAKKYYIRAAENKFFPGFIFGFSFMNGLDFQELVALSNRLKVHQAKYEGAMSRDSFHFDKDCSTWDAEALALKAAELLSQENPDKIEAQMYLEAAARVNPFDVKYAYFCARLYLELGNMASASRYLNEILVMDPENSAVKDMVSKWNSYK